MRSTVFLAALVGLLIGLGLGLSSNVSGVVLGFYGLALATLFVVALAAIRRRRP